MPFEGQALRVRGGLRRRDKVFLAALAGAGATAVIVGALLASGGSHSGKCVSFTLASTMGGATTTKCGAAAKAFCRAQAADVKIAELCRREGF